jgi:hypothetical protein
MVELTGRDAFHTSTTRQTADGWLGNAVDVVPQDLPVGDMSEPGSNIRT